MKKFNKPKIFIVDDSEINRSILTDMLEDEYEIIEAEDGEQAIEYLKDHYEELSLILLDIVMPKMDGFDVLALMNKHHWIEEVPVIMISAENSHVYTERAFDLGVTDYIKRPFDAFMVRKRVINTILLYAKQKKLINMVSEQIHDKEKSNNILISVLSHIVEFRNKESGLHVLHINVITEHLLRQLITKTDKYDISFKDINLISMASSLHDIGKVSIPESILNKPGKLTKEEFEIIKTHSMEGAIMLDKLSFHKDELLVRYAYEICRWHHERYDGKGYPDGLKGDEIPISAQVVSIADVYDALTSERVYKPPFTPDEAIKMISNGECGVFNPVLVECLIDIKDTLVSELKINSLSKRSTKTTKGIVKDMMYNESLNISERTLQLLERERTKYQFFAEMSGEIQFEYENKPPIITLSEWGANKLGIDVKILNPFYNEKLLDIISTENINKLREMLHNTTPESPVVEYECFLKINGEQRWHKIICRATWTSDDEPEYVGAIGKAVDIHDTYTQLADLEHEASHDSLTKIFNHKNAKRVISELLKKNVKKDYALLILDLDNFADSNNTYGHMFGDEVLKYVAQNIKSSIRSGDVAGRIGGDELLIFVEYKPGAEVFIDRIFKTISGNYKGFRITFSMGIALTAECGRDYDTLFKCADTALYAAKKNGRKQYCFYNKNMEENKSLISPIDSHKEGN